MSVATTVNGITNQELTYLPAVLAGIQAAEAANAAAPGQQKAQAVLDGIVAGASVEAGTPGANPNVAAISALISLSVSIFSAMGIFKHKATATAQ